MAQSGNQQTLSASQIRALVKRIKAAEPGKWAPDDIRSAVSILQVVADSIERYTPQRPRQGWKCRIRHDWSQWRREGDNWQTAMCMRCGQTKGRWIS